MKHLKLNKWVIILLVVFIATGCVPLKKLQEMEALKLKCEGDLEKLKVDYELLKNQYNTVEKENEENKDYLTGLQRDTSVLGTSLRTMTSNYRQLNETYELLLRKNKQLVEGGDAELIKVQNKLIEAQKELSERDLTIKRIISATDSVEKLNISLKTELEKAKTELKNSNEKLSGSQNELSAKDKKLKELQAILNKQDSIVTKLKKTVSDAFLGFENKGLTVNLKNGKVYVSLEENLLFAVGSTTVDEKGIEALKKLGKILENDTTINIMIEGHTDNIPYVPGASGCIRDNWDLSVLRATSIVRILTKFSKIDPKRLTVAGRGPYLPIDNANTPTARAKNRRIEIILTPKLDEVFKMIESN